MDITVPGAAFECSVVLLRHAYETVSMGKLTVEWSWRENARIAMANTLLDPILAKLLNRSALTKAQFETLLVDLMEMDLANKKLTREEMTHLRRSRGKISRGAFYRTLLQARANVAEAVHTVLLLGYAGMLESPSLAPFVEASEVLGRRAGELRDLAGTDEKAYEELLGRLLDDLERAGEALQGRERDA